MRKFYLLGMMSFLFSGMAWADDYVLSFDDAAVIWNEDCLTWDATTGTMTFKTADSDTWGNGALGWLDYVATDLSAYNTLVVELAEASDQQVEVCVSEDGFWDTDAQKSTYIAAGDTECSIDLTSVVRGDGDNFDLTNINLIFLRTNWTTEQEIVLSSIYLTYVEDEETETSDSYEVLENYASLDFLYDDEGTAEDDTDDVAYGNYCSYTYASNLFETSFSSNGGNNAVQFHLSEAIDISGYDYLVIELAEDANVNFMPGLASGTTDSYWGSTEISICQSGSSSYTIALDTCAYTGTTVGTVVILTEWGFTDASLDFESIRFEAASEDAESDDTLTGIQSVENSEAAEDDVYYNLSGVRVANPSKGLYIKNGKKVIIK